MPVEPPLIRKTEGYLKTPDLKARGWTDTMIRRFLPIPDALAVNHWRRSGPRIKLYLPARVEAVEVSAEFVAAREGAKNRRAGAVKAVATKRDRLREYVEGLDVEVPEMPFEELVQRACDAYNQRKDESAKDRGDAADYRLASPESDPEFLARICVNHIRHRMTDYEAELGKIAGKVGAGDAYLMVSEKVFDAIGDVFPELRKECQRQQEDREARQFRERMEGQARR